MPQSFLDLNRNLLFFDGAMGTMLQKQQVLQPGEAPEILNLTHPDIVAEVHRQYLAAGAQCIETNTFGASRIKLSAEGLESKAAELNTAAVKIAKSVVQENQLVAASIGPTGRMIEPLGDLTFEDAYIAFLEQVQLCAAAGADLISIETMSDIQEAKAAVQASLTVGLPVIASVSFMENGRLLTGFTPEMVAATLSGYPLLALGTNCGLPAVSLQPIIQKMAAYTKIPLIVQPNAGKPSVENGTTVYQESAAEFGAACMELIRSGARVIGGCCGTSPEHIRELRQRSAALLYQVSSNQSQDYLVSKSMLIPAQLEHQPSEVYLLELDAYSELWNQFISGSEDSLIDLIFEIDSQSVQVIRIQANELDAQYRESFRSLVQVLATYWPNLVKAELTDPDLIQIFLSHIPGRAMVCGESDPRLIARTERYGGVYQVIR
jgi:methionine synthase I (cobalamin-dependent)